MGLSDMKEVFSTALVVLSNMSKATNFITKVARFFSRKKKKTNVQLSLQQPTLRFYSNVGWKARGEGGYLKMIY